VPSLSYEANRQGAKVAKTIFSFLAGTGDLNHIGDGSSGISRVEELLVAGRALVTYSIS
jgi:hypothetical protein